MHKLQTNKGARYFMIAFIVLFLIMLLRFFYIQAVGVVQNVNVKDLANEQHNKMVFWKRIVARFMIKLEKCSFKIQQRIVLL